MGKPCTSICSHPGHTNAKLHAHISICAKLDPIGVSCKPENTDKASPTTFKPMIY